MALRVLPAARRDITEALVWSAERFGTEAARRYKKLIATAIEEIGADYKL